MPQAKEVPRFQDAGVLSLREYLTETRRRSFSVVMVVFLLAVYEAGVVWTDPGERNAADLLIKEGLARLGDAQATTFHLGLLALFAAAAAVQLAQRRTMIRFVLPFLFETLLYAALLSPAVLFLREPFLSSPSPGELVLDLGAGVYEEIVFRLIAIRGLFFLLRVDPWHVFFEENDPFAVKMGKMAGPLTLVIVTSALLFAAYHHVGPGGEPVTTAAFLFRAFAGLILAGIYFWRGLAAAVYTHALYDLLIHVLVPGT